MVSSTQDDTAFLKTFIGVMALLTVGTIIILSIAMFAGSFDTGAEQARVELERERAEQRLQPVGAVRMDGDAAPVDMARADGAEASNGEANGAVRTASEIYQSTCTACHGQGVMNAPRSGDEEVWEALLSERGLDGLVENAINGKAAMPPRGGDPSLSDEEVRSAVVYMLEEAGQPVED